MDGTLKVQTPKDARFGPLFNENTTPTLSRGAEMSSVNSPPGSFFTNMMQIKIFLKVFCDHLWYVPTKGINNKH